MLQIIIPSRNDLWDERKEEFVTIPEYRLNLEHSLVSLSKWEAKWHKPFMTKEHKTVEETMDYIKCMTLNQNVDDDVYKYMTRDNLKKVNDYIENPMTATTIMNIGSNNSNGEFITSELIYCWMIMLNIPFECQKWHLNRLLTLIRVCEEKTSPPKKMPQDEVLRQYAEINKKRREQLNSKG